MKNITMFFRKIMKYSAEFFDGICFGIGPFLTIFFLLSFIDGLIIDLSYEGAKFSHALCSSDGIYDFTYLSISKIGVAFGITLICLGFVRKYLARKE